MQELKLQDFLGFHFLSALKLFANGHIACFLVSQCNHKLNCYTRNLWSINTITRQVIQLTENQNLDSFLWLDENTILFQASQNGLFLNPVSEFKLLRLDGGEAQPAFRIPLLVESIKAISQSRFIVQAKTTRSATEDLIESGATWTILDELPFAENGAGFVSGVRHRLYLYDSVEQSLSPITDESFQVRGEFVVHPDGSKVAYMGMHISHMEEQKLGIYLYDVAMGTTKQLLPLYRYKLRHIDFLGDKVLFTGADGSRYVWSQNAWFYTLDIQTGSEQVLFPSEQMPINNSINSDCRYGSGSLHKVLGSSVYHVITQDGSAHLVKTTQNKQEVVSKTAGSIDCVDIIGQTAYMIATRGNQLQEVYTLDLSNGEEHCLTCFNEDYVKTHEIGTPVSCDFQNANGDWIQGWVLPPSKYVQGKKYPAILEIHGGPKRLIVVSTITKCRYFQIPVISSFSVILAEAMVKGMSLDFS